MHRVILLSWSVFDFKKDWRNFQSGHTILHLQCLCLLLVTLVALLYMVLPVLLIVAIYWNMLGISNYGFNWHFLITSDGLSSFSCAYWQCIILCELSLQTERLFLNLVVLFLVNMSFKNTHSGYKSFVR